MPVLISQDQVVVPGEEQPTGTTPPPEIPVEPTPQEAVPAPPPDEAPPLDTSNIEYRDPEQQAALAPIAEKYGNVPAEAIHTEGAAPAAGDPGVITTAGSTDTVGEAPPLSGEPIQTPAPIAADKVLAPGSVREQTAGYPGPLEQAANTIGQAVAPLMDAAPGPVQEVANAVGKPVGGLVSGAQDVGDAIATGGPPEITGAALAPLSGGYNQVMETTSQRLYEGKPATPQDEVFQDPSQIPAILGGLSTAFGPTRIASGLSYEDWWNANRDEANALFEQGGWQATTKAWQDTAALHGGGDPNPPPELSNPFEAATSDNPIIRGAQLAGGAAQLGGDVIHSAREGTLAPFVIGQAQQIVSDPLTAFDLAGGHHITEPLRDAAVRGVKAGAKALPIVRDLTKTAPSEVARLGRETAGQDIGTYLTSRSAQEANPIVTGEAMAPAAVPAGAPGEVTIVPVHTDLGGHFDARSNGQTLQQSRTIEPLVASYPGARVLPGRQELIQTFENNANELLRPNDTVGERRLRDSIVAQNPEAFPEETAAWRSRQAAREAYANAPPEVQNGMERAMGHSPRFVNIVSVPDNVARRMADTATPMTFADGYRPRPRTGAEIAEMTVREVNEWLSGHTREGTPLAHAAQDKRWRTLNERYNPGGRMTPEQIAQMTFDASSPQVLSSRTRARDTFTQQIMQEAMDRAAPGKHTTAIGREFAYYTNTLRQVQLFHLLHVPKYMLQNLIGNTSNIVAKGGGPRVALEVFTDLHEGLRQFRNMRDPTSATTLDSLFHSAGVSSRPNIKGGIQKRWMDRISPDDRPGRLPSRVAHQVVDRAARLIAPETARLVASIPDVLAREKVGSHAMLDGFHQLNGDLVPMLNEELQKNLGRGGQRIPTDLVQRAVDDFKRDHARLTDINTDSPYTTFTGRVKRFEPTYTADEFRVGVKENLVKSLPAGHNLDMGQINRAVNDVSHQVRNLIDTIADQANTTTNDALFSWTNTVGDEWMAKGFLYHYWASRQAGFYAGQAIAHPWMAAAYGRMINELRTQSEEQGAPDWLKGWLQFMGSTAGYSTFFNPMDMVTSLLTNAQFQYGDDPSPYDDLTSIGRVVKGLPFFVHPAITTVAYHLGLLGPDYPTPEPSGLGSFDTNFTDLLNLANSSGAPFMKWINDRGIGVDEHGNKVAIPTKSIQDLMAHTGNAISTALEPLTGLSPVEVRNFMGSQGADMRAIGEQEVRKAHPEWGDGSRDSEMRINREVTSILEDTGSAEYQRWYKLASAQKYDLGAMPQPLAGILRSISPFGVATMPEQRAVRSFENLPPSGKVPVQGPPDPNDPFASDAANKNTYGMTQTLEGRRLAADVEDYKHVVSPELEEINNTYWDIAKARLPDGEITINGTPYTNEELQKMGNDAYQVARDYLAEQGYDEDIIQSISSAKDEYLREHPTTAAYESYTKLIGQAEGATFAEKEQAFTQQMMQTNPSFAQYVNDSMTDHITGAVDYRKVYWPDAFLAAQGVSPSVYSPTVGNEPSTAPGGYPSIPGVEPGQPILPAMRVVSDAFIYAAPYDVSQGYGADPEIGILKPDVPIQAMGAPQRATSNPQGKAYDTWVVKVAQNGVPIGYVDASLIENVSPTKPIGMGTVQQPGGGLTETAGNVTSALGGAKDALFGGVGEAIGGATPDLSGAGDVLGGTVQGAIGAIGDGIASIVPAGPSSHAPAPDKAPAPDTAPAAGPAPSTSGITVHEDAKYHLSPWAEGGMPKSMVDGFLPDGTGTIGWDFRDNTGEENDYYGNYFTPATGGHGYDHPGVDIWGEYGKPVSTPAAGKVVCTHSAYEGDPSPEAGVGGFGCGAFEDTDTGGVGKVEIQLSDNTSLIFGHMNTAGVAYGDQVTPGTVMGRMGGMSDVAHVHAEARLWCADGSYHIVDPTLMLDHHYDNQTC